VVDIPDAVTYTNFGDHRLRGFWVAGGQISRSPIDFHRRPYNTLALPCERVITAQPYASEVHAVVMCPFVRLFVASRYVSKRLDESSWFYKEI